MNNHINNKINNNITNTKVNNRTNNRENNNKPDNTVGINNILKTNNTVNSLTSCEVPLFSGVGDYVVRGELPVGVRDHVIVFWAANPPTYNGSFSGSGLPFPNAKIAYENTPNRGAVQTKGGKFEFKLRFPNSYYEGLGTNYVKPHVNIRVCGGSNDVFKIQLGDGIPYRSLTWAKAGQNTMERKNPLFYGGRDDMPVVSQEQLLRNSAFPCDNKIALNFWGGAVPHP